MDLAQVELAQEEIRQHLVGGKALAKFEELIQAQIGDIEVFIVIAVRLS